MPFSESLMDLFNENNLMDTEEIRKIARARPKESLDKLHDRIRDLKSKGGRILECILYVKTNQQCSLKEAKFIVVNSDSWLDQKKDFLQHQEDMRQEYIDDSLDRIQQEISTSGTNDNLNNKL